MDYLQYYSGFSWNIKDFKVLNLIINGLPSILNAFAFNNYIIYSFKPYYKWITFNIKEN